jgi:hypothetical protein
MFRQVWESVLSLSANSRLVASHVYEEPMAIGYSSSLGYQLTLPVSPLPPASAVPTAGPPPATLSLTLVGSGRGTPIPCPPCLSHQGPSLIHLRSPRASLGVPRPPIDPCPLSLTMLIARYNYIFSSLNAARSLDLLCFLLVLLSPMVPPCAIRHPRSA